jgi:excisionase family DNA binding protein
VVELLKVREVSARLRLSKSATYQKIADGEIEAIRLGHGPRAHLRVPAEELERFLSSDRDARADKALIDAEIDHLRTALRKAAP